MTLLSAIEDTSKALFSDGSWYIVKKTKVHDYFVSAGYPYDSIVYHQCRNHWKLHKESEIYIPLVQYRLSAAELDIPCSSCGETCPEALQGLWKLHNFDSIQSDS